MTAIPQEGTSSNRYLILGRLAGGGMADIFLARSTNEAGVERYVVLKRVLAERSRDPHFATMFLDEARLAAQLQHPNIAQVHDIGKLAGSYFYTMEYVHGEDLRHVLMRLFALRRPFPLPLVLHVASGVLAGLHHAHTRTSHDGKPLGVVHRDVTPSNVMVSYEGNIKVLDFGVAKATQRVTESRSGTIKGKIAYLSPEQCQGAAIDRRSDIYAFGIVLHEMLTGRRLYKRDTDFATMMAIVQEPVAPPSAQRADLSPELDRIVLTALEKDPARRYATAAEMIEAIEELAQRERHVMSGTALGKFMRELFGDRPEPWLELAVREEEHKPVTVTGESVVGLDPLAGAVPIAMGPTPSGGHVVAESFSGPSVGDAEILAQMDHAPPIGHASEHPSGSLPRADTATPTTTNPAPVTPITTVGVAPPPAPSTAAMPAAPMPSPPSHVSGPMPAYPTVPAEVMADYRAQPDVSAVRPSQWRRGRLAIAALVGVALGGIAIVLVLKLGSSPSDDRTHITAPIGTSTTSVTSGSGATPASGTDTTLATSGSSADRGSDATHGTSGSRADRGSDATLATSGSNADRGSDATHATSGSRADRGSDATHGTSGTHPDGTGSNAASSGTAGTGSNAASSGTADTADTHPASGSNASGSHRTPDTTSAPSDATVLEQCTASPPTIAAERTRCGVAACKLKQKAAALGYWNATSGTAQQQIERACKDHGIALRPRAPTNPCADKQYREENPLKCQ